MTVKTSVKLGFAALLLAVAHTQAVDLFYSATGPGYYPWDYVPGWIIYQSGSTPYNQLPTANDDVLINATAPKAENGNALTVTNGVFAECNMFAAGYQNYPGTAWFRLDGGSLTCASHFVVGRYYPGLATLESGALYSAANLYVSSQGGVGVMTNNGATVEAGSLFVANNIAPACSVLVQNSGSLTLRSDAFIGHRRGCEGMAILNGGSLDITGEFRIGNDSNGAGIVTNTGAAITANNLQAAYQAGAFGRLIHTGGTLATRDYLQIGRNGGIGECEMDAPFSAKIMIIGSGLAPNPPGTGTVTMAENAVGTVKEFLRVNNGDLFMRGGQIHLQNVGNPNRTNLYVRTGEDRRGLIRGWGYIGYTNENITLRMINNGQIIADGEGEERELDLNMIAVVNSDIPVTFTDTNGWYAVNKGCVRFPRTWQTFTPGVPYCWGDLYSKEVPELVNSVGFTFTTSVNAAIRGGFYAADRSDIPAGLPAHLRPIGVWQIGAFRAKVELTKATFDGVSLTFRYDHTQLRPMDSSLRLYRHDGSAWVQVGSATPGGDPLISTDAPLAPVSSGDYNIGWFAVMAVEQNGTLISVR
ncbi:MAG TPA: hypothetical protein P5527_02925 [Kiritimatiellia bacterium]|nr:hypothetical protein [Kiritimatiellia bacterium]